MRILTRYVAKAYLRMLALCMGAFIAIYLVVDFMEKIARFTRSGAQWYHIALFFVAKTPEIVSQAAPLAVLMATLLTLGTLSMNSELTAMRSCGIGLARITAPRNTVAMLTQTSSAAVVPKVIARLTIRRRWARVPISARMAGSRFPGESSRRSFRARARSTMRASRLDSTPRIVPMAVSRKTGATESWMTWEMS